MKDDLVKHNLGKRALLAIAEVEMRGRLPLLQFALSEPSLILGKVMDEIPEEFLQNMSRIASFDLGRRRDAFHKAWDQNPANFRDMWTFIRNCLKMSSEIAIYNYTLASFETKLCSVFDDRFEELKQVVSNDTGFGRNVFATVEKELREQRDRGKIEREMVAGDIVTFVLELVMAGPGAKSFVQDEHIRVIQDVLGLDDNATSIPNACYRLQGWAENPESRESKDMMYRIIKSYIAREYGLYKGRSRKAGKSSSYIVSSLDQSSVDSGFTVLGEDWDEQYHQVEIEDLYSRVRNVISDPLDQKVLDLKKIQIQNELSGEDMTKLVRRELNMGYSGFRNRFKRLKEKYPNLKE